MADKQRKNKATKAIVARRVEEVLRIRLDGAEFWDVLQYVAEKQTAGEAPWIPEEGEEPLAERTVWWYIHKTDELLKETFRKEDGHKRLIRRHIAPRRLKFAKSLPLTPTLERELSTFTAKITMTGNETFAADWRQGQHDDLVLACSLAAFIGEQLALEQKQERLEAAEAEIMMRYAAQARPGDTVLRHFYS